MDSCTSAVQSTAVHVAVRGCFRGVLYQLQGFLSLSTDLSLDKMSVSEKLILMERLWEANLRLPTLFFSETLVVDLLEGRRSHSAGTRPTQWFPNQISGKFLGCD